ncbi:MAG: ATP-binding protein [Candidatus Sumerlaeota bacterium]|nr:ATP-binding protein [Candidatus Sumerlaeota bacterium]
MNDSIVKIRRRARPTVLIATVLAFCFITLALALYELDRQRYMAEKRQLIIDNFNEIFKLPTDLTDYARQAVYAMNDDDRRLAIERLRAQLRDIVNGAASMYRFMLKDPSGHQILTVENATKPQRLNTWRNNLFLRSFEGSSAQQITKTREYEGETPQVARLIACYTSPANFQPIIDLTTRYRYYALGLIAIWCALSYIFYIYLLRPVRNVTSYVERSKIDHPRLIPAAHGFLEISYNDIASLAILQRFQERLYDMIGQDSPAARAQTVNNALDLIREAFGGEFIAAAELTTGTEGMSISGFYSSPNVVSMTPQELLNQVQMLAHDPATSGKEEIFQADGNREFSYFADLAGNKLAMTGRLAEGVPDLRYRIGCFNQACESLRGGLMIWRAYQQGIVRQRSEANIVLSRNLGHDLTNIIATSKLDLMAVRQILAQTTLLKNRDQRTVLLKQAIEGLLQSMKFLQEIVNIYRSFSFVKKPQYERYDLNALVKDFLQAFQPSVSARIAIDQQLSGNVPTLILEPRLIKLAFFNILTNALDAIKRSAMTNGGDARIIVRTAYDPETHDYRIEVEDNGPGIRATDGRLLGRGEISAIFTYGYSTKSATSEGLGLSWVRTIIEDFHDGAVRADNMDTGGARFTLSFKSMEASEARI